MPYTLNLSLFPSFRAALKYGRHCKLTIHLPTLDNKLGGGGFHHNNVLTFSYGVDTCFFLLKQMMEYLKKEEFSARNSTSKHYNYFQCSVTLEE